MLKVGLIGCGGIAPAHIWAYQHINDVKVEALCDLNIEKANDLARKNRVEKTYTDYWDMIESNELDLIDICTPIPTHAKIVCDVAKAVPSIFLEKPMALTVSECDEMIDAFKKYGTNCCINHLQLYAPLILKMKNLIKNNEFDLFSLKLVHKESSEYLNSIGLSAEWNVSKNHGGIIWEVCSHPGYLQLHFLPEIKEVYALGGKTKYDVYDNFAVFLRTSDDRYGIIELNWVSKETESMYEFTEVNGKRIKVHYYDYYTTEHTIKPPQTVGNVMNNIITDEIRYLKKWANFGLTYLNKGKLSPMYNIINEYVTSLKNGQPSPVPPKEGRKLISLLDAIKTSLIMKKPIKLV